MAKHISGLDAHKYLRGSMTACSWQAGWRSLLLRAYDDPPEVEDFITPATKDHLIVLVTSGSCDIEARYRGGWQRAHYRKGHIGMTAAGDAATLRWRGDTPHSTLQLHLPDATIRRVMQDLSEKDVTLLSPPSRLTSTDPLIEQVMLNLSAAFRAAVPDLYAETAAELLAAHLLVRYANLHLPLHPGGDNGRLSRVEAFMRANLAAPVGLEALAKEAGISRFHLLRLFKRAYGETPLKRLTRLRMEEAKRMLRHGTETVTTIASLCGYENPSHFATAFRRIVSVSPRAYREQC